MYDGCEFDVEFVGGDEMFDVVLFKLNKVKNFIEICIVDFDKLWVGDFVVVIGNLFGLG